MKSLLLTLLPLCSALTGSHVQVSIGGSSYTHGAKVDQPQAAPAPAYTTAAPVYHQPATVYHKPTPVYHEPTPVYHEPTPVYHKPATVYHKPATVYHKPTPVYQEPTPVYHEPTPVYPTAAPVYHQPAPIHHTVPQYHTEPQYQAAPQYHTAPKYHTPKQNCSVVDDVVKAKVCTPAFETKCASIDIKVKVIVDKEQCQDITRTVCSSAEEVIENKICVYSYEKESKDTVAKTVEVTYAKECTTQRVTVCQPAQGHSYHSYGQPQQYCKEEDQETCYNVPKVTAVDTKVSVTYPSPIKSCSNKPITIPRVTCEDIIEEKCITVPDVKEETEKVEKCEVSLAEPKCQYVDLTLPKQVCVGLVYGHAVELTAKQYHAKVL